MLAMEETILQNIQLRKDIGLWFNNISCTTEKTQDVLLQVFLEMKWNVMRYHLIFINSSKIYFASIEILRLKKNRKKTSY